MKTEYKNWLGKQERQTEFASSDHLEKLVALLDGAHGHGRGRTHAHGRGRTPARTHALAQAGELPPLAHWIFCQPIAPQSNIDRDGHIQRGDFMPPVPLPRRMWASSEVTFIEPLPLNENLERLSTIESLEEKTNKKGEPLVFLTVRHKITGARRGLVEEAQHIVYKSADSTRSEAAQATIDTTPAHVKEITFDEVALFRFAALSFNAHRIHYDRDYAKGEGYPSLVVQGPYLAFLLLDHYLAHHAKTPHAFHFRALSPLFDGQKARFCAADTDLWIEREEADGSRCLLMTAQVKD